MGRHHLQGIGCPRGHCRRSCVSPATAVTSSGSHIWLLSSQGLDRSQQSLEAVFALRELICLKDPALLSLEVVGFITKYPDVR